MAQNIFVSYNFTDRKVANKVKGMISAWQQDLVGHIVQAEQDVSYNGPSAIKWQLHHILNECQVVLFVIGENAQNSPWLNHEVEQALQKELPIFVTRIPNTLGKTPQQLQSDEFVKVCWDTNELNACLAQACLLT